jgi:hypothetical protein
VGRYRSFGEDRNFREDQTQCNLCKQCDFFLVGPQFYRSDVKSSA